MAEIRPVLRSFVRVFVPPLILAGVVFVTLREPLHWWLHGDQLYDEEAIKEWVREARVSTNLPELVRGYVQLAEQGGQEATAGASEAERRLLADRLAIKREEIGEHLKALGNPPTKMYPTQLPLFPVIYRLEVSFDEGLGLADIAWDSELPRQGSQYQELALIPLHPRASVKVQFHLHAYQQRELLEQQEVNRRLWLSGLGIFFAILTLFWVVMSQARERTRERQRLLAQQQINETEKLRLHEELRRQEAERKQEEAERQNLELKSQIFANIGIMAGSYAHNIKNLLVRPNDLLRRCLDESPNPADQGHMLREVKQTLGTVTERLQQILQTVRRDPTKAEKVRIDLDALVREMVETWSELARDKWKLEIRGQETGGRGRQAGNQSSVMSPSPLLPAALYIEGDLSHLQQALENLLFNARDATFEMRNHLREQARQMVQGPGGDGRQALIAAAGWKGVVTIRTERRDGWAVLEIQDNGIGMTEEVKRRCLETHFSTKRNNALFAGLSAGMGLGLSFVTVILEHHGAKLEIESEPYRGSLFRILFPPAA